MNHIIWNRLKILLFCQLIVGLYLALSLTSVRAIIQQKQTTVGRSVTQTTTTSDFNIMWQSEHITPNGAITLGDFDGDGRLDIATSNTENFETVIYLNQGNGAFSATHHATDGIHQLHMTEGDMDGDGDLDILTYNASTSRPYLHVNDGQGNFTTQFSGELKDHGTHGRTPDWGDVDSDGDLDILTAHNGQLRILINNGTGIFTENTPTVFASYTDVTGFTWGDVNQDGRIDILLTANASKVYLNQGGMIFSEINSGDFQTENIDSRNLVLGDMDRDGDLDLALGYNTRDTIFSNQVYENDGNGVFTNITAGDLASDIDRTAYGLRWGDIDGDGDLDLAVANYGNFQVRAKESNQIYRNDGNGVFTDITAGDLFDDFYHTENLAWGDLDNDGDLDLAVVNREENVTVYENNLGYSFSDPLTLTVGTGNTEPIYTGWGDIDGDQDLDIVIGNTYTPTVYTHLGSGNFTATHTLPQTTAAICGLALGDSDGDNDLELILGGSSAQLYANQGLTATTFLSETTTTLFDHTPEPACQLMWGDADNDEDLDLLAVQDDTAVLYRNDGNNQFALAISINNGGAAITSAAWADVDGDNDLDLFVGSDTANRVYLHDGIWGFVETTAGDLLTDNNDPQTAVWGDIDGDSDLDLFLGNQTTGPNLYRNEGGGTFTRVLSGSLASENGLVTDADIGDIDGDGDLDLLLGLENQNAKLYRNNGTGSFDDVTGGSLASDPHLSPQVALGDGDGDGDLDVLISTPDYVRLYFNHQHVRVPLNQSVHHTGMRVHPPENIPSVPGQGTADIVTDLTIPIPYTLWANEAKAIAEIEAWYSPNGGGDWYPAVAASGTPTQNIQAGVWPTGTHHTFYWDTFASNFSGQSNDVVIRLIAKPHAQTPTHAYSYLNEAYFPQTFAAGSSSSLPFRILTTHIQVFSETADNSNAVSGAVVYQQTVGSNKAVPISDANSTVYTTDLTGYLSGLNEIAIGDQLFALSLVSQTGALDFYHMSAPPTLTGLDGDTITKAGPQTLVVSADNPLIVANLDISLEWDAREDVVFLAQLGRDLSHASEVLFDVTDGQLALGNINVYHNKENWEESHIVIYTNNNMRPNVDLGGITTEPVSATLATGEIIPNGYLPGQVRMPREWNRFGNDGSTFGSDWALALAHELVHYVLFIPDNYLGVDELGRLIQIDCAGSVMTNAYLDSYSELLTASQWSNDPICQSSVAAQTTGRSDWETAQHFYPELNLGGSNLGPYNQPLDLTNITFIEPDTDATTIGTPTYFVENNVGQALSLPRNGVNVYRIITQNTTDITDDRLVRLGATQGDIIDATGIEIGDKLCLHDNSQTSPRRGCIEISDFSSSLTIYDVADWAPEIDVDLVTSNTIKITVTQANINDALYAQLFPIYPAESTINTDAPYTQLSPVAGTTDVYTAEISANAPFFSGDTRIWEANTTKEEISNFFLGGGWGPSEYGWGPSEYGWGPSEYGWGPSEYGWGSNRQGWAVGREGWNAPLLSGDGNVTLFDLNNMFGETPPYTIQQLSTASQLPDWLTSVGSTYRVSSPKSFTNSTTIMFSYMQRTVPSFAHETRLQIYYRPQNTTTWQALDTVINSDRNLASALMVDRGDYALIAVETYPMLAPNIWNPFGYTIHNSRPIAEALASIEGSYRTVLWYDVSDQLWDIYDPTIPPPLSELVNTLQQFEYGQGYWIYATDAITPYLGISTENPSRAPSLNSPPMVIYGWLSQSNGTDPADGTTIVGLIDGEICGQGIVEELNDRLAYTLQIPAAFTGRCKTTNAMVSFAVNGRPTGQKVSWTNSELFYLQLNSTRNQIYLPLVQQ